MLLRFAVKLAGGGGGTMGAPAPDTDIVELPPFVTMLTTADASPAEIGVKTISIEQADPGATPTPQLFVCRNRDALAPEIEIDCTSRVALPVLVTVMAFEGLD